ncbi:hypothetical protein P692DRAFT_20822332 [Suillus brevipes Sb2]|nr:hypothetical protein P692DRAFT_20822332 [Suillus brevipes Sb2]
MCLSGRVACLSVIDGKCVHFRICSVLPLEHNGNPPYIIYKDGILTDWVNVPPANDGSQDIWVDISTTPGAVMGRWDEQGELRKGLKLNVQTSTRHGTHMQVLIVSYYRSYTEDAHMVFEQHMNDETCTQCGAYWDPHATIVNETAAAPIGTRMQRWFIMISTTAAAHIGTRLQEWCIMMISNTAAAPIGTRLFIMMISTTAAAPIGTRLQKWFIMIISTTATAPIGTRLQKWFIMIISTTAAAPIGTRLQKWFIMIISTTAAAPIGTRLHRN